MRETLFESVEKLIDPFLKESDLILVDLRVHSMVTGVMIQILTDHPQGGVTLVECSQLNRKISLAIDQENLITQRYTLEVSSPGLDRPLKSPQDFFRAAGRPVKFFLSQPVDGKWEHQGIVRQVTDEAVLIENQTTQTAIPLNQINKAQQTIGKV